MITTSLELTEEGIQSKTNGDKIRSSVNTMEQTED
jgi:hypothetical protein